MTVDASTIATAVGSTVVGAGTTGWIAKTLITNYLRKNDEQHGRWRKSIDALKDTIDKQQTNIAVINTKLDYMGAIRADVEELKKRS